MLELYDAREHLELALVDFVQDYVVANCVLIDFKLLNDVCEAEL